MTFKRLCLNIIKAAYPDAQHEVGFHPQYLPWRGELTTGANGGAYADAYAGAYVRAKLQDGAEKRYYAPSYEELYRHLLTITFEG